MLIIKSKSRLGLLHTPFGGSGGLNEGVTEGPEAIVGDDLDDRVIDLSFPTPEEIRDSYLEQIADEYNRGIEQILRTGMVARPY